jgi:hypothetical protein
MLARAKSNLTDRTSSLSGIFVSSIQSNMQEPSKMSVLGSLEGQSVAAVTSLAAQSVTSYQTGVTYRCRWSHKNTGAAFSLSRHHTKQTEENTSSSLAAF